MSQRRFSDSKCLTGDSEPAVIAECFNALMAVSPSGSLSFIASFMTRAHPSLSEAAALAIGESRTPEAFAALQEKWQKTFDTDFKRMLLLPIALTRQEAAQEFLLSLVETADVKIASGAIAALALYRGDEKIRGRVKAAVASHSKAPLRNMFQREFG